MDVSDRTGISSVSRDCRDRKIFTKLLINYFIVAVHLSCFFLYLFLDLFFRPTENLRREWLGGVEFFLSEWVFRHVAGPAVFRKMLFLVFFGVFF